MSGPLVVVGDALLDVDLVGVSRRLCPDAPAPVVEDIEERPRPGGAALAAYLAASDGGDVVLVTPLAEDPAAERLRALLAPHVRVVALPFGGSTPVKQRVRVDGTSLLRLDTGGASGSIGDLPPDLPELLAAAGAVLVSDYGRGTTAHPPLRAALQAAPARVPLVWDPHPRGAAPVPGVRLATPSAAEAAGFTDGHLDAAAAGCDLRLAGARADALVTSWQAGAVAVTLGRRGALLSYGEGAPMVVPASPVTSVDPCGAGDRFAAAAAVLLAGGAVASEAVTGAVAAATAFVAAGGASAVRVVAAPADPLAPAAAPTGNPLGAVDRVRAAGGTVVATGGCFDILHAGHVATLRAARDLGDCLVVCINSDASVRRLKGPTRPIVDAADRQRVLEALECVDAVVIFEEDTPEAVLARLRPDVWAKGGDYAGAHLPEADVVRSWGGSAVVLPYLDGRSTTAIVQSAAGRAALEPVPPALREDHRA